MEETTGEVNLLGFTLRHMTAAHPRREKKEKMERVTFFSCNWELYAVFELRYSSDKENFGAQQTEQ